MTEFDYSLIAIVVFSLLLGLWRGVVYEVLSILGWPLAFMLSRYWAPGLVEIFPVKSEAVRVALAYGLVFVAALLVWAMLVWLVSKLVAAIGLGWIDGMLGALFGVLRGALIILVLVWLAGMTKLPEQMFWREAKLSHGAEQVALMTKSWLPDNIAQRIKYRVLN